MEIVGIQNLWVFIATSFVLITSPGIDTMLVLNRSMTNGKKIGFTCVLGIASGILVHTLLGVLGISVIISEAAYLFSTLKLLGATYLIYLGIAKLLRKTKSSASVVKTKTVSHRKSYFSGLVTNVFNPKVALFFLAFFPQFIDARAGSPSLSFLVMGAVFTAMTFIWLALINVMTSYFSNKLVKKPRSIRVIDKISGLAFLALGFRLAFTSKD